MIAFQMLLLKRNACVENLRYVCANIRQLEHLAIKIYNWRGADAYFKILSSL